jgi:hypothetical protein
LTEKNLLKGLKQIIATAIQNIDTTNPKNNNKKENIKTGATTITISFKKLSYSPPRFSTKCIYDGMSTLEKNSQSFTFLTCQHWHVEGFHHVH